MRTTYEKYHKDENPFIRMHTQELRIEQRDHNDYMKGPERLKRELETASRETSASAKESGAYGHVEFNPQEVSRFDSLKHLLDEFNEDTYEYAADRSVRHCIEFVARDVIANTLETLNKKIGRAWAPTNAETILNRARVSLLDCDDAEAKISAVLNHVIEENDVRNIEQDTVLAVIERIREILEIELTGSF